MAGRDAPSHHGDDAPTKRWGHPGARLTVQTLVLDPLVRTEVIAGAGGVDREVTWAHTCELRDPWNWMGPGDLLMSDGYGFPVEPAEQETFIRNLAGAGISGLTLAEGFVAPALSEQAAAVAEELNFPILRTARSVPFVTIARAVAEANYDKSAQRAANLVRLYSVMRRMHARELLEDTDFLSHLGRELDARLNVIGLRRGRELLPSRAPLAGDTKAAIVAHARARAGLLAGFTRLDVPAGRILLLPVGTSDSAALVVQTAGGGKQTDLVLAQHAAMICGLEVDRREARTLRAHDRGAALVDRMLKGSVAPETAEAQLRNQGAGAGPWRVMAWRPPAAEVTSTQQGTVGGSPRDLVIEELFLADWALVQRRVDDTHLVVVAEEACIADVPGADLLQLGATVGLSQPFVSAGRFADATREARWALESAGSGGSSSAEYGAHGSYFMPRTVAEGESVVRRLLGAVIDYDAANNSDLVNSLRVFFEVNRSWQEGARRLGIHKQTLVYRIKKIEELTAVDLRHFGTQAEMFMALRAHDMLSTS